MTRRRAERAVAVLVAAVVAWLGGCGGHGDRAHRVSLSVSAASGLADAPVAVEVRGLRPRSSATLRAAWRAFGGRLWTSRVQVRAGANGTVALRGVDGMRFLWDMRPTRAPAGRGAAFAPPASGASTVALAVDVAGRTVARARLPRRVTQASVRVRSLTIRRDGVAGVLFMPAGRGRRPGAVVFGGSEGRNAMIDGAGLLAAHGYPSLALAYFREPGLPSQLVHVPLEYFVRAVRLLRRAPGVDPRRIAVMGLSRGSEAALLVASTFSDLVHGAIALVPSAVVNHALNGGAAWTLRGRAVPPLEPIPVERINGPVLAVGAGADVVWGSAGAVAAIRLRLADHRFRFAHQALVYPHAGHWVGTATPYLPAPTNQASFGGTARADAAAKADLWPRILRFFAGPFSRSPAQ